MHMRPGIPTGNVHDANFRKETAASPLLNLRRANPTLRKLSKHFDRYYAGADSSDEEWYSGAWWN
jgi:hypothetical protein